MIDKALVLLPPRPGSLVHTDHVDPLTSVGGITLLQRSLYGLQKAGILEGIVLSGQPWPELERSVREDPRNLTFGWVCLQDLKPGGLDEERLARVLSGDLVVHSPLWIVDHREMQNFLNKAGASQEAPAAPVILEPAEAPANEARGLPVLALLPGKVSQEVGAAIRAGTSLDQIGAKIRSLPGARVVKAGEPSVIRVEKKGDRERAEQVLFSGLIKPTESLMSRRFERRVSLAITRQILHTRITPNQISVFSICLGLIGALLFLPRAAGLHVLGALLLLSSSIIDGCDGELARLRFQESRLGSWLDFLGDNLVHMAVFFCIGLGLYGRGYGLVYPLLGALGALATLGSVSAVFSRIFRKSGSSVITFATPVRVEEMDRATGSLRRKIDFADKISNRDFIYLILILAAVGQLWVWPWLSGVGASFYFAYLLYLYRKMDALSPTE